MKQATQNQDNSYRMTEKVRNKLRETIIILIIAVAAYLTISLLTYHNSDPGWSSTGTGSFVANSGGRIGAWIADISLYIFGYLAYLFPMILIVASLAMFFNRSEDDNTNPYHTFLLFLGMLIILLAGCGLAGLYLSDLHYHLPLSAGGILGNIISLKLVEIFNLFGSSLLLGALLLVGITLLTNFSWFSLFDFFWKTLCYFIKNIKSSCLKWHNKLRDKRSLAEFKQEHIVVDDYAVIKDSQIPKQKMEKQKKNILIHKPKDMEKVNFSKQSGLPSIKLLDLPPETKHQSYSQTKLQELSRSVEAHLRDFGIEAFVVATYPGPVITRFELQLAPGVKVSKITPLVKDLARSLSTASVRVVEVIPGKAVIGLEIPNEYRELVYLREIFESRQYVDLTSPLSLTLGKDIAGYPVVVDLTKMPHVLVSGTTGAGKSVSLNSMLLSMLYKSTSEKLRLILIDPKMLELSVYEGIPHLLTPVVTDMKEAANAFRWCVAEMDRRYKLMATLGVRNLLGFNKKVNMAIKAGQPIKNPFAIVDEGDDDLETLEPLPYICVVVDELADMMMVVGKKVEELIARIAQKARAAGIHMILATQRPSVDVITGLIKANICW